MGSGYFRMLEGRLKVLHQIFDEKRNCFVVLHGYDPTTNKRKDGGYGLLKDVNDNKAVRDYASGVESETGMKVTKIDIYELSQPRLLRSIKPYRKKK